MKAFRRLALATTLTTIGVIGVGGLVRATNSGKGCPAWPKCFGRWIPPLQYHAIIEYSHRAIGAIAIGLLAVTAFVAVLRYRRDRPLLTATLVALLMIFVQAGLGAIVVNTGLNPTLVTVHIGTAMILVGLLVWITVGAYCRERTAAGIMKQPVSRSVEQLGAAVRARRASARGGGARGRTH